MNRTVVAETALGLALGMAIGASVVAAVARWSWERWVRSQ